LLPGMSGGKILLTKFMDRFIELGSTIN